MNPLRLYEPHECGPDHYPRAWHTIDRGPGVKHLVREQAGHRCVRCHHPYLPGTGEWSRCDHECTHRGPYRYRHGDVDPWLEQPEGDEPWVGVAGIGDDVGIQVEARWRILTVHHLRLGNDAKRDLRWWNLAALCQRCHLQVQGKVQMERIWPHEHSDWFKPYAAGWYAWSYLREDLAREETMARLDELLALERIGGVA